MRSLRFLVTVFFFAFAVWAKDEAEEEDDSVKSETPKEAQYHDSFAPSDREAISKSQESFTFQAETSRLMDILINSLYSNRDVFIRELVSNSADALDKVRFLSLTNPALMKDGEELGIKVSVDKDLKTLTLTDTGIGMTKQDLIKNLGIVAKSGTSEFLEASKNGASGLNLIGQFGVGFYSAFLVADKVTVTSKNNDDDQYIWESNAQQSFTVTKDERGNTLGRGTQITLHLKEDAEEYLDADKLQKLMTRYSQFINFPIKLKKVTTVEKPKVAKAPDSEDGVEVTEEDDDKTEAETEQIEEWVLLNDAKSIWMKNPKDVSEEEYDDFFKTLTKDNQGALDKIHFVAEGEITFRAILYIPKKADPSMYDKFYDKSTGLKLYVRRVLISDEFEDFLPRYMNFVKGIVDSDDLPLNVSRETLAQSRVLKVMAKKLTRKVLEMLRKLADDDAKGQDTEKKFEAFYKEYSKSLKMGVMDDKKNKSKLVKLLRFQSSTSEGKLTSFESYIDRMKESQDKIYFLTCEDLAACESNPIMEKFKARGLEVLYMDQPIDEYCSQQIPEVDGIDPVNILRESATLPETKDFQQTSRSEENTALISFFKSVLGDRVTKVIVSNKLTTSPAACTTPEYGWTGNMERIMRAQALSQARDTESQKAEKVFEFNPYHPIIRELSKRRQLNPDDESLVDLVHILYESAATMSGYSMAEPEAFAKRIHRVISLGLDVDPDAKVEAEAVDDEVNVAASADTETTEE